MRVLNRSHRNNDQDDQNDDAVHHDDHSKPSLTQHFEDPAVNTTSCRPPAFSLTDHRHCHELRETLDATPPGVPWVTGHTPTFRGVDQFLRGRACRVASPRIEHFSDYLCCTSGAPISVPINSPEITSSTRRFCCRPSAVSLEATGWAFPKPRVVTEPVAIPSCVR
jgi:hypothetical protein